MRRTKKWESGDMSYTISFLKDLLDESIGIPLTIKLVHAKKSITVRFIPNIDGSITLKKLKER